MYDYQHKYVTALLKQLPLDLSGKGPGVLMHPPSQIKTNPIRQGPFLLQPAPLAIEGCESGNATDIVYLSFTDDHTDVSRPSRLAASSEETDRLGVVLVAYQEGKVDVFLDVEKVEARWERKVKDLNSSVSRKVTPPSSRPLSSQHAPREKELPMLAVYETIDLGLVSSLSQASLGQATSTPKAEANLDLLKANHPVFLQDPIHDEAIYVYHAFGVHSLQLGPVLQSLAAALKEDANSEGDTLGDALEETCGTDVQPILTTWSGQRK